MSDLVPPADGTGSLRAVHELDADCTPISELARESLRSRLRRTRRRIRSISKRSPASPESIHKLRVAIRRSEAALLVFGRLLPKQRTSRLRRQLKRLRQLAGEVRDIDVFLERCIQRKVGPFQTASDLADFQSTRAAVAKRLQKQANQRQRRIRRFIVRVLRRVRWREPSREPSVACAASELLRPVADRCLAAATVDLDELRNLHRLRIEVKRLRYATELLQSGLSGIPCARLLQELAELQQSLGQLCDHAADVRLLEQYGEATRENTALLDAARRTLDDRQSDFVASWKREGRNQFRQAVSDCLH